MYYIDASPMVQIAQNYNSKTGVWEDMNLPKSDIVYFERSK
jgi:hypothetical protein